MIYTFYSYKGGVGRSMALVNIAELLYRAGLRVIMVDWDLEAPGLERFYPSRVEEVLDKPGVIDMLLTYKSKAAQFRPDGGKTMFPVYDIEDYTVDIYPDARLRLLPAGHRSKQFFDYANRVKTFNWHIFYDDWGGEIYFEWLRRELERLADVVLVDSRTGVTEMGGVCTYQLADVIVMFCATNIQNIDGTLQMLNSFSDPHLPRLRSGRELTTLVIPARTERFSETPRLNDFRQRFAEAFAPHQPPSLGKARDFSVDLEIPYVPAYAFEETIAVKQTRTQLRSVELEEAYVNLLQIIRDLAPKDSIIRKQLRDLSLLAEDGLAGQVSSLHIAESAEPASPTHYLNAKVVLVGDSGVGKSGLAIRIAEDQFRLTESTHGAQFWQIPIPGNVIEQVSELSNVRTELTLWDLAGQPEYRLVSQFPLDNVDVALLLFDYSDPSDPFRGVPYWARVLKKRAPSHALKFLVSSRIDVCPVTVDRDEINRILTIYELDGYLQTSAKTGEGVVALMQQIIGSIPWDRLPRTTVPRLFRDIRGFLLDRKEAGDTIIRMGDIQREVHQRYTEQEASQVEIDTVVALLQARGLILRLDPTPTLELVLLRPDLVDHYASSIIRAARNDPRGVGAVPEREVITASLPFVGFKRLEPEEEKIVLESTVELLIQHDLCFREMGQLVFPSQLNITRPPYADERPLSEVTYRFSGSVEAIYASLVVRLSFTEYFQREAQWKYAAEFSHEGYRLGFSMQQVEEGVGKLEIYFYPGVSEFDRVIFIRFITDHLRARGTDIQERIRPYCAQCGREVESEEAIEVRLQEGKLDIPCQYCGAMVTIPRSIEEWYRSDRSYVETQRELVEMVDRRTQQEVIEFRIDRQLYTDREDSLISLIRILHLSDIHLETQLQGRRYRTQLETDLIRELEVSRLEYLVISGDIATKSTPKEYDAAFDLVDGLAKRFGLDSSRIVVVPGNHDVNWDLAENAYPFVPIRKVTATLRPGDYIPAGEIGMLVRNDDLYRQRFAHFSAHFYRKVYNGLDYPLDYAEQAILHQRPDDRLLFLALNSAWEIDHYNSTRSSINKDALNRALSLVQDREYDDWLKIAVWHHPVTGHEMMNDEFLQLLAVHGFQICMHGHIHDAIESYHRYDAERGLRLVGAGTFGAPARAQVRGIPLQYNLLILDPETRTITVKTRRKEKPDGAWSADARWGDKHNPIPRYTIKLKGSTFSENTD